ncbi:MAG: alcohol dehydrogenase catalytic domain-containing protein, partial [Rhizomicrobium sp.]
MKALLVRTNAEDIGIAKIEDVTLPGLDANDVRIRVRAAAVNFPDILMIQGKYQHKPELPFVVGGERAGDVIAVGSGVTRFKIGDRVVGGALSGGFAEEAQGPENSYRPIPGNADYAVASAYTTAYLTAYVSLVRRGELAKGETLLVHG